MVTAEQLVENILKEVGVKRGADVTPHVLSKAEMKDVLCRIVDLKNENEQYRALTSLKKEIVDDILNMLNNKGGDDVNG